MNAMTSCFCCAVFLLSTYVPCQAMELLARSPLPAEAPSLIQLPVSPVKNGNCEQLLNGKGVKRINLLLTGIHSQHDPETIYRVFLNLPVNRSPLPDTPGYIGDVNFYGITGAVSGNTSFDLHNAINALREQHYPVCPITISFVPLHKPATNAQPGMTAIELWGE